MTTGRGEFRGARRGYGGLGNENAKRVRKQEAITTADPADADPRSGDDRASEQARESEPAEGVPAKHPTEADAERTSDDDRDAFVEETSRDSYPGSDAPAW